MIYSIRVSDIPKFLIAVVIGAFLLKGLIALWKSTGGMADWIVYLLLFGIIILSPILGHYIWAWVRVMIRAHRS
jgi:glycerol uptake facilitator-like aquaporin